MLSRDSHIVESCQGWGDECTLNASNGLSSHEGAPQAAAEANCRVRACSSFKKKKIPNATLILNYPKDFACSAQAAHSPNHFAAVLAAAAV